MPTQDRAAREGEAPPTRPASDDDLFERLAAGDAAALTELYDRHAGRVFSLSLRIVGDETEAGRVVEQVFSRAWREAAGHDAARGAVAGWLLEAARTAAIEQVRAARPADAPAADAADGEAAPEPHAPATLRLPSPARGQEAAGCTPSEASRLRAALEELPALSRLAIELAYFEGLTLAQIAARLEHPETMINERLLAGLRSLRGAIEDGAA